MKMRLGKCIHWLWKASDGVRCQVAVNALAGVIHVSVSMLFVWVCKVLVDSVTSGVEDNLLKYVLIMTGCMALQIVLSGVIQHYSSLADISLKNSVRHRLFVQLMGTKWNGKEQFHSGDTLNRVMDDVRIVAESIAKSVPVVISAGVQFIAAFVFLFWLEPGLAWTIPCIMIVMLLISKSYVMRIRKLTNGIRSTEGSVQSLMQESLQHRIMIHTLESTPYVSDTLYDRQQDLSHKVMDKTGYSIFTHSFIRLGFSAGYAAAFLWGVFGIRDGAVTFGMMTAFLQLVGQIQRPVMNLTSQLPSLINSITSAERIIEIENQPSDVAETPLNLGEGVGVRLEGVGFSYPESQTMILDDCSFDFKPGKTYALVGETGIGKSTVMRLMLGLLVPDKGKVIVYNDNVEHPASAVTRCNFVYVPQGNTLMSGTIRENLLLADPAADDDMMYEALYLAAADFVRELPDGLETLCGEKGTGLSEGQAQRVAIARALLRTGAVLLLDEPASALDAVTEETFIRRMNAGMKGRTIIMITHRQSSASMCDHVVKL